MSARHNDVLNIKLYLKFFRYKIDVLRFERQRVVEKLSETLAALQRPQIYQIADQMDSPPTETSKGESYTEGFMA